MGTRIIPVALTRAFVISLGLVHTSLLHAQEVRSAQPAAAEAQAGVETPAHFRPMEFLVGRCWIGTFPDGKQTDEHCFEWVYEKKFIRDRHIVRGGKPYEGETLYAKQGSEAHVSYWYWSSAGGMSTGRMEATGDALIFPERHATADGVVEMRAVWRQTAPDRYRVVQEIRRGDQWTTAWTMELVRRER